MGQAGGLRRWWCACALAASAPCATNKPRAKNLQTGEPRGSACECVPRKEAEGAAYAVCNNAGGRWRAVRRRRGGALFARRWKAPRVARTRPMPSALLPPRQRRVSLGNAPRVVKVHEPPYAVVCQNVRANAAHTLRTPENRPVRGSGVCACVCSVGVGEK